MRQLLKHHGRAMALAVSRQPLTAEAQFHALVSPRGICGGQSGTGTVFSPSSSVFLSQYNSIVADLHTRVLKTSNQNRYMRL
jgi:hypothetical protein